MRLHGRSLVFVRLVVLRLVVLPLVLPLVACPASSAPPAGDDAGRSDLARPAADLLPTDGAPDLVTADLAGPPEPDLRATARDLAAPADVAGYVCYGDGTSFPTFPRECQADNDCFVGIHQIDCCGSHAAYGLAKNRENEFAAAEAAFRVRCPALCNCIPRPTVCDDGKTAPEPQITVTCEAGRCTSHGL